MSTYQLVPASAARAKIVERNLNDFWSRVIIVGMSGEWRRLNAQPQLQGPQGPMQ